MQWKCFFLLPFPFLIEISLPRDEYLHNILVYVRKILYEALRSIGFTFRYFTCNWLAVSSFRFSNMNEVDIPQHRLKAPSLKPECIWHPMTPDAVVPETAIFHNVKQNGEDVYIGRVDGGTGFYIGTAFPKRNTCMYLDKNLEVKSSSNYEILTIAPKFRNPLFFVDTTSKDDIEFELPAGTDDEIGTVLYVGRYIDNEGNTYYGWMYRHHNEVYIPRDVSQGPQVVDKHTAILRHENIHMICRGCPTPLNPSGCY